MCIDFLSQMCYTISSLNAVINKCKRCEALLKYNSSFKVRNMTIDDKNYNELVEYMALFENEKIRIPVCLNFDEKELLVLLSLFGRSEIMGLSFDTELISKIEKTVPTVGTNMVEKGWLSIIEEKLVMCPQIALSIMCMSCAEKTVVFTNDSLQAAQELLSVYIYRNKFYLSLFKSGNTIEVRIDSNLQKMCHYLFTNYLCEEESPYHSKEFIRGLSRAFEFLEDESLAIWNKEFVKRFFAFKVFDKKQAIVSSTTYNYIQFEETGAGIYEMSHEKLERCDRMYNNTKFYFEKHDYAGMFVKAFEVICNG